MRHAVAGRQLNRDRDHRRALRRNLVQSLIEHGEIRTTQTKAREVRAFAERLVTLAVKADAATANGDKAAALALRQRAIALLNDRAIIAPEMRADYDRLSDAHRDKLLRARTGRRYRASKTVGGKATAESVIHKLFATIGPRMRRRNDGLKTASGGGYTRMVKLADRRVGDGTFLALLQLVKEGDAPRKKLTDKTERKRRTRVRLNVYAGKPRQQRGARRRGGKAAETPASAAPVTGAGEAPATE